MRLKSQQTSSTISKSCFLLQNLPIFIFTSIIVKHIKKQIAFDIMDIFKEYASKSEDGSELPLRICAPMVRYSKLPFRMLVRLYDCDVAYTPMIMANSFSSSQAARDNEFTTNSDDRPLIVQFAANKVDEFVQ